MTVSLQEPLLLLVDKLELALEAKFGGREKKWTEDVERALQEVEAALPLHMADLESHDEIFPPLDDPEEARGMPLSPRRMRKLRQEHTDFVWWAKGLRRSLHALRGYWQPHALPGLEARLRDIRHRGRYLVARLRRHQEAESDLLLESLVTDIGGGD